MERPYIRTSKEVFYQQQEIALLGSTATEIYDVQLRQSNPFTSVSQSQEPRYLKQVQNSRSNVRKQSTEERNNDELMSLFTFDFLKTISASKPAYFAFLYQSRQINYISQFCCTDINATTLAVDTTFNLCDLWVTDITYRIKRLVNVETKKHPIVLRPIMLPFTKDDDAFSRFALESLHANKEIRKIKTDWG